MPTAKQRGQSDPISAPCTTMPRVGSQKTSAMIDAGRRRHERRHDQDAQRSSRSVEHDERARPRRCRARLLDAVAFSNRRPQNDATRPMTSAARTGLVSAPRFCESTVRPCSLLSLPGDTTMMASAMVLRAAGTSSAVSRRPRWSQAAGAVSTSSTRDPRVRVGTSSAIEFDGEHPSSIAAARRVAPAVKPYFASVGENGACTLGRAPDRCRSLRRSARASASSSRRDRAQPAPWSAPRRGAPKRARSGVPFGRGQEEVLEVVEVDVDRPERDAGPARDLPGWWAGGCRSRTGRAARPRRRCGFAANGRCVHRSPARSSLGRNHKYVFTGCASTG